MRWHHRLFSGKTFDAAVGRESRSAFIAQAAFWFAALRFMTHDMSVKVGAFHFAFGKMDPMLMAGFLLPCLSLYFGRRLYPGPGESKTQEAFPKPPGEIHAEAAG